MPRRPHRGGRRRAARSHGTERGGGSATRGPRRPARHDDGAARARAGHRSGRNLRHDLPPRRTCSRRAREGGPDPTPPAPPYYPSHCRAHPCTRCTHTPLHPLHPPCTLHPAYRLTPRAYPPRRRCASVPSRWKPRRRRPHARRAASRCSSGCSGARRRRMRGRRARLCSPRCVVVGSE